jgi:hypothetical protein
MLDGEVEGMALTLSKMSKICQSEELEGVKMRK